MEKKSTMATHERVRVERVELAKSCAERFLRAVTAFEERVDSGSTWVLSTGTRESGAMRRASMDLTRALADLRRPS